MLCDSCKYWDQEGIKDIFAPDDSGYRKNPELYGVCSLLKFAEVSTANGAKAEIVPIDETGSALITNHSWFCAGFEPGKYKREGQ